MEATEPKIEEQAPKQEEAKEEVKTIRLAGVRFSRAGKVHSFSAEGFFLSRDDLVAVEGDKGNVIGIVVGPVYEQDARTVPTNIKKVLRKADAEDLERHHKNREEAMRALKLCQEKISLLGLSMKLVDVDVLIGDAKAIFYFTAEERVDFRELVKILATALHMRIEMRQIGARDAAKGIGSMGSCGLVCCCEAHLREFRSISIQMAKNQGLSPNPAKLTGMCGKLKCCMSYENPTYIDYKKTLPNIGAEVETPKGVGPVRALDIPRQLVSVYFPELNKELRFGLDEIKVLSKGTKSKATRARRMPPKEAKTDAKRDNKNDKRGRRPRVDRNERPDTKK